MRNLFLIFGLTILMSVSAFAQEERSKPASANKPDVKTPATPEVKPALPKADEIIDRYVQALGGEAAIKKITSRMVKGTLEIPAAGIKGKAETFTKAPNKSILIATIPGFGEIIDAYDGKTAWTVNPAQGMRDKAGEELAQVKDKSEFYRELMLKDLFPKREVTGTEKIGEVETFVLKLTDKQNNTETWYFDAKTFLLVKTEDIAITPEGKMPTKSYFSDYREVDGVKIPFLLKSELPQATVIIANEEVKHNVTIDDAKFAKPKE